ncbi:MAG: glycosyltransferase [Rhodoferax sp.]|jgi:glycosyltransferase involved in cell wall biosynthesis|uniref:glycosyltransferase n=1 Tax=Rhodoferax sp. TaxID=50421 RepID=UPI001B4FEB6D|nr:glycosyltransferase [Rhodoferax sp.]MBP9147903.1 glycosyltransferase [Rhodoferax sp.]MBP9735516.1 glycosyltransferase [Rhodoferax sp.]
MSTPYRVLLAHNVYQQAGGEDAVVQAEIDMLRQRGHAVELFSRHNDLVRTLPALTVAMQTMWSHQSSQDFERLIQTFQPDVVHVHNTLAMISPSIYWVANRFRIPVVQTLHNFRLLCPQGNLFREGLVCEDCLGRLPWRGAMRACYRESVAQTTVLAGMLMFHRAIGTWQHKITRYIALNEFCRAKFIEGGLPPEKLLTKPNFVNFPVSVSTARDGFLFVGRLSHLKGVGVLADAVNELTSPSIRVAGTGPDAGLLQNQVGIELLGPIGLTEVRVEMTRATALILPSVCYDSFPRTLVEAFACGLPVIASRMGSLPELIQDGVTGLLFESGNAFDLAEKMRWAQTHPDVLAKMGQNARRQFDLHYSEEENYRQLMSIYKEAIQAVASESHGNQR